MCQDIELKKNTLIEIDFRTDQWIIFTPSPSHRIESLTCSAFSASFSRSRHLIHFRLDLKTWVIREFANLCFQSNRWVIVRFNLKKKHKILVDFLVPLHKLVSQQTFYRKFQYLFFTENSFLQNNILLRFERDFSFCRLLLIFIGKIRRFDWLVSSEWLALWGSFGFPHGLILVFGNLAFILTAFYVFYIILLGFI